MQHLEDILSADPEDAHLAECPECKEALARFADIGLAAPEAAPSPEVLERVLASVQPGRFALILDQLARFFDVTRERARVILDRLDSRWVDGPSPGIWMQSIKAGPRHAGRFAGILRLSPGVPFPAHRHLGPESLLVLEGSVRISSGEHLRDGQILDSAAGSAHDLIVDGDDDCIAAVVQEGGMEFGIKL